jgi:hypothetical protein
MNKLRTLVTMLFITITPLAMAIDTDVKKAIKAAPVADSESILLAVPLIIGVTNLPSKEKERLIKDFETKVAGVARMKVEQRRVVATILDKLTLEDYPADKMNQLVDWHSSLEDKMVNVKKAYIKSFIKSVKGKVTKESVKKTVTKLEEQYKKIDEAMSQIKE